MGSERQCGLGSLVPMSCRGRAEAFARRLHTRLRSLGAEPPPGGEVSSGSDVYFDLEAEIASPQSPQSPVESGCVVSSSPPGEDNASPSSPPSNSDSDATYYDIDADSDPKLAPPSYSTTKLKDNQANKANKLAPDAIDHLFQNRSDTPENQSPIKTQPLARDAISKTDYGSTRHLDTFNVLYSPIKFDDCSHIAGDSSFLHPAKSCDEISSEESVLKCAIEEQSIEESKKDDTDSSNLSNEGDGDGDGDDDRPQRVRRCSSLRSGKTPPGTPGRKKIVRFADVLGLDLADVKTFMDDIPNIPKSAFEDLQDAEAVNSSGGECFVLNEIPKTSSEKCLVAVFQQPGDQPNFVDILNSKNVCLENARVQEGATIAISGTVRVRNLDFHKSVQIRYTLDNWKSFSDLQASYVPNSCDGFADKFQFLLYAHTVRVGQTLEFAVRFMCKGCQYWDNNSGANYCFQCLSSTNSTASLYVPPNINPIDTWHASFF
ncbi:glycogen binding subunit 76A [Arctopsyche grandis]|uniref:glycogen binding subunit 76A n=1 Tax=Arctopsyche grandis TaxID=121162 RepID=UPI00406D8D3A